MGLLDSIDANTPVKNGVKWWKGGSKASAGQYAQCNTPIASSSPAPVASEPELEGTAAVTFDQPGKLGVTFQEASGKYCLKVISFLADSQAQAKGIRAGWRVTQVRAKARSSIRTARPSSDQRARCVLQIKDVSVAGLSFKDAMKFVSIQERPLCVRFATPLAEGDAPTDGGAPASAEEAKPEAKPEAAAIEQEKAKLIAKEAVLLDELKKLDEKETAPAAAAAFNPFAPGAAAAAAPAAAAPANPFGSPPASRAPAALPNPFAPAAMAAARSSPKVATMETQRQIYHYDRNSFSVKPAGMATECRNLSAPSSRASYSRPSC